MNKWYYKNSFDEDVNFFNEDDFEKNELVQSVEEDSFCGEDLSAYEYVDEKYIKSEPAIRIKQWKVRIS